MVWQGPLDGRRRIEVDRFEGNRDRAFSAFLPKDEAGDALGEQLWATNFALPNRGRFSFPTPPTKKGLNCLVMVDDAVELGVGHVVENIAIGRIVNLNDPDPELYQVVDGEKIGFNSDCVRAMDERFRRYAEAGIDATGILLKIRNPRRHTMPKTKSTPRMQACSPRARRSMNET